MKIEAIYSHLLQLYMSVEYADYTDITNPIWVVASRIGMLPSKLEELFYETFDKVTLMNDSSYTYRTFKELAENLHKNYVI